MPELSGRVDPDSEGHEMLMSLFGGLSKAERCRLQIRTHNAVLAHGIVGLWLGGRPNYGYRLIDTNAHYPQRQKAAAGIKLRVLEPDPDTAPVVRRIFEMFDQGSATGRSATSSSAITSPAQARSGRKGIRRSADVWGGSAVRAILTNRRYLGRQVVGRQRRRRRAARPHRPRGGHHQPAAPATNPRLGQE